MNSSLKQLSPLIHLPPKSAMLADQAKEATQEISESFEDYTESAEGDLEETEEEHEQQIEDILG